MYLILAPQNYIVINVTNNFSYIKVVDGSYVSCDQEEAIGFLDLEHNTVYPMEFTVEFVEEVPSQISLNGQYCYEKAKGFYKNTEWTEPIKSLEEINSQVKIMEEGQIESELDIDLRLSMIELGLV